MIRGSGRVLASTGPWLVVFVLFLVVNAYIRRQWIWIVGDDQNLMMPAIDLGRGYTPNLDFVSGYPGLTFYVQRLVMLFAGERPVAEHIYTALQAAFFGGVAAFVLRKWYPPALVWLMVAFLWTVSHAVNPTPNPGFVVESLALLAMVLMERVGREGRLPDAAAAGALAALAFLFKQYGIMLCAGFILFTSLACLASPKAPAVRWRRAAIVLLNVGVFAAYIWVYLLRSVFLVPHHDPQAAADLPISTVAFLSPWVFALSCLVLLALRPRALMPRGLSFAELAKTNLAFGASLAVVGGLAIILMYGLGPDAVKAIRAMFLDAPATINSNILALQPLQLWPELALTCPVVIGPLLLRELRNPVLQLAVLVAIAAAVLYTARTYTDLKLTVAPTLTFFLLVAVYLVDRPEGEAWSWFFVFVSGSTMLAYLIPYPYYMYNMGILIVSGWAMMGGTFHSPWPALVNPVGAVLLAVILALALKDGRDVMNRMATYEVGSHWVKSYDPSFGAAVEAANKSTPAEAEHELYDYLIWLAHLP